MISLNSRMHCPHRDTVSSVRNGGATTQHNWRNAVFVLDATHCSLFTMTPPKEEVKGSIAIPSVVILVVSLVSDADVIFSS